MPSYAVTGASRGIGREFVRQLSEAGNNTIFAIVRNKKTSPKLLELAEGNPNIHIFEADITDHKALKAAAAGVGKISGGKLDVLINNAAYVDTSVKMGLTMDGYGEGREAEMEEDFRYAFNVNVIGVIHTVNAFLPLLRASTSPLKKVITLSSGIAEVDFTLKTGFDVHVPYCVSKAAANMVNAKYAAEYANEGFVFLALSPGLVATAEEAPSKEEIEVAMAMGAKFAKVKPDIAPISPEYSVTCQLDVISKVTAEQNGAFLSHYGNKEWL